MEEEEEDEAEDSTREDQDAEETSKSPVESLSWFNSYPLLDPGRADTPTGIDFLLN